MPFKNEAELCDVFISNLPDGWTSYPETGNWDILLVHTSGAQIGVEAKLKLNAKVVEQASSGISGWRGDEPGPDFRAILIPKGCGGSFLTVTKRLGLTVIRCIHPSEMEMESRYSTFAKAFTPSLPNNESAYSWGDDWFDCAPSKRVKLPEYVPQTAAGVASPTPLSHWKISAIRLCVLMEKTGFLLKSDFKHFRVHPQRWMPIQTGWLSATETRGVYAKGEYWPAETWRSQHPGNYKEIEEDFDRWAPKDRVNPNLGSLFAVES